MEFFCKIFIYVLLFFMYKKTEAAGKVLSPATIGVAFPMASYAMVKMTVETTQMN